MGDFRGCTPIFAHFCRKITKVLKIQECETNDVFFINTKEALKVITHDQEKELLEKAINYKKEN